MERSYGIIPYRQGTNGLEVLMIFDNHGNWGFPKGHGEANEEPKEAAKRELAEETSLHVAQWLESPPLISNYETNGQLKQVTYFLATVKGEAVARPPEVTKAVWLTLDEALKRASFPETEQLIQRCQKDVS